MPYARKSSYPKKSNGPGGRPPKRYVASSGVRSGSGYGASSGARPAYGAKPAFGAKRPYGAKPAYGAKRPYVSRPRAGAPTDDRFGKSASALPVRKYGDKPSYGAKPAFGTKRPYGAKPAYGSRPSFGAKPAYGSKPAYDAKLSYGTKPAFGAKRPYGNKPAYNAPAANGSGFGTRPRTPEPLAESSKPVPRKYPGYVKPEVIVIKPKKKDLAVGTETSWGKEAAWYDELLTGDDTYQAKVVLPHLKRLMGVKEGNKIADIACGQGYFSFALADEGVTVHGADVSAELITLAEKQREEKAAEKQIRFSVAPSDNLSMFDGAAYDHAVIVLAIQNIDDVAGTFAEAARILKPGASLHIVMNHPAFRIPKASSWGWDETRDMQYRRVDKYMSEAKAKIAMHPGSDPSSQTISFHRPLQYFVKALARKGFAITGLEEWSSHRNSDSGPRAEAENKARAEFPMFMYLQAKKLA